MRTRQRLIELIDSLGNGVDPIAFTGLNLARDVIAGDMEQEDALRVLLAAFVRVHPSPHVRDLSAEALHYMESAR